MNGSVWLSLGRTIRTGRTFRTWKDQPNIDHKLTRVTQLRRRSYSSLLPSDLSVGKDKGRALDRLAQQEKGKELLGQLRDAKSV